jgi:hypothetical protein
LQGLPDRAAGIAESVAGVDLLGAVEFVRQTQQGLWSENTNFSDDNMRDFIVIDRVLRVLESRVRFAVALSGRGR